VRHVIGLTLTGLGIFLLVGGILVRFYVAPRLITAPTDIYQITTLRATNASYFDAASLKVRTGATLTATNTVRGDAKAGHGDIAVWDSFTAVQDLAHNVMVSIQPQRVAFDRRTAQLTNCCGASVQGDTTTRQSGIGLFWPINVAKRNYSLFDSQTKRAWPIRYAGQESVHGVRTYRFVEHIPATKLDRKVPDLPGGLLGLDKKIGAVAVDPYYEADVTYWVDPRTGTPLNERQKVLSTLQAKQGPGRLVVADMDLQMTDTVQRTLLAKSEDGARGIRTLTTVIPLAGLLVGAVTTGAGILLNVWARRAPRRRRRHRGPGPGHADRIAAIAANPPGVSG
jgi:hypothetical protein